MTTHLDQQNADGDTGAATGMSPVTDGILDALNQATDGHARRGTEADAVLGAVPGAHVAPADTAQVSAVMTLAAERGLAVVPCGTRTKLAWGNPPQRVDILLDLSRLNDLVDHAAGDLVAVAGAGMTLADLQERLAERGQRLAVDPARGGTLGGLIVSGDAGPLRLLGGAARDLVLGCTFVRADGVVAKAGGRVVKNVAGYDLSRVFASSYGTLVVLTEVTLRLHPLPPCERWVEVTTSDRAAALDLAAELVHTQLAPSGVELDARLGGEQSYRLALRLEGTEPGVLARTERAVATLERAGSGATGSNVAVNDSAPDWWGREPEGDLLLKITYELASAPRVLAAIEAALPTGAHATWRASTSIGVSELAVSGLAETAPANGASAGGNNDTGHARIARLVTDVRSAAASFGGSVVVRDAPLDARPALDAWGDVGPALPLMRALKDRFDPEHILSPGRFVGGI